MYLLNNLLLCSHSFKSKHFSFSSIFRSFILHRTYMKKKVYISVIYATFCWVKSFSKDFSFKDEVFFWPDIFFFWKFQNISDTFMSSYCHALGISGFDRAGKHKTFAIICYFCTFRNNFENLWVILLSLYCCTKVICAY